MKLLTFKFSIIISLLLLLTTIVAIAIFYTIFNTTYLPLKVLMIVLICAYLILMLNIIHYDIYPFKLYKLKKYAIIQDNVTIYRIYYKYFLFYSEVYIKYSWQRNDNEKQYNGKPKDWNSFNTVENAKKCIERLKQLDEEDYNKRFEEATKKFISVYKE